MGNPLRVLFVEDSEDDLLLLLRHLRQGGYAPTHERVDTAEAMAAALEQGTWDLILSDYSMPQFSAPAALALLQRTGHDIPFIVVSGTIGEEAAVAALKAGAHDFVAKLQPARLIPAVERELREVDVRREHRRAQQALRESEERFRQLAESIDAAFWLYDFERGRTVYASPAYEVIWGRTREELYADPRSWARALHPHDRERVLAMMDLTRHAEYEVEYRIVRPDGEIRWIHDRGFPIRDAAGQVYRTSGLAEDVTAAKRSAEALKDSEERLRLALRAGRMATWEWNLETGRAVWSHELAEMHGFEPQRRDDTFDAIFERIHPPDRVRLVMAGEAAVETGRDFEVRYRIDPGDGATRQIETRAEVFTGPDGGPLRIVGVCGDVTERVRAEEALQESEEYFRALIENGAELITVIGADGRARYLSPSYDRILGYAPSELLGEDVVGLTHPEDLPRVVEAFEHMVRDGLPSAELEARLLRRDGAVRTVRAIGRNMLDVPAVRGIVVNAYDVTERNELEAQFLQAQKMEAVGRLAGGIAHDFNNLLTGIQGYTEFVLEDTPAGDPRREDLEEIRKGVERAAVLTRRLLAFSRRQIVEPRVLDLAEVLGDVRNMLQRLIGEDIELRLLAPPDLGNVRADPGQIEQVLLNLLVNARDAMPDGGTVTIELANVEPAAGDRAGDTGSPPPAWIRLTVVDTGVGMEPEIASRIFEPFFTTKPEGKGTGLGLSTVHGIVTQNGGRIRVQSEPGCGARFDILLPRVDPLPETNTSSAALETPPAGRGTVLVVEDEAPIRVLAARALRRAGYTVLEVSDGLEALKVLDEHPGPIDLVITDMVMPRAGGMKVVAGARAARPDARILVMSGYSEEAAGEENLHDAGVTMLEKPFSPEALVRKANDTLKQPRPARE